VYGCLYFFVVLVYGCLGVWVYGYMGVWVYGSVGIGVQGCMGLWGYMYNPNPNTHPRWLWSAILKSTKPGL